MTGQIAQQFRLHPSLGEIPTIQLVMSKLIFIMPGDDALEGKVGKGLQHGEPRASRGGLLIASNREYHVRRQVLCHRAAVLVDSRRSLVDRLDLALPRPQNIALRAQDSSPGKELSNTGEIADIDSFCVGEEEILDRVPCVCPIGRTQAARLESATSISERAI